MKLHVVRSVFTSFSTIGEMLLDGQHECYTLEPPKRDVGVKPRCTDPGTYDVRIFLSPKFKRLMPHVMNVPGFDAIEIHWGNFPDDTDACTLVGETKGPMPDFIGSSKKAFDALFLKLSEATDPITITYTEAV